MLLEEAKGVRSWLQFSSDCGISYVQMRKLAQCEQENPPRPKLIRKVASQAFGEVDLEDLMFAAGVRTGDMTVRNDKADQTSNSYAKYRSLPLKDRRTVDKFIDFLLQNQD